MISTAPRGGRTVFTAAALLLLLTLDSPAIPGRGVAVVQGREVAGVLATCCYDGVPYHPRRGAAMAFSVWRPESETCSKGPFVRVRQHPKGPEICVRWDPELQQALANFSVSSPMITYVRTMAASFCRTPDHTLILTNKGRLTCADAWWTYQTAPVKGLVYTPLFDAGTDKGHNGFVRIHWRMFAATLQNFVYSAVRDYYNYVDEYWRFASRDMFLAAYNLGMRTPGSAVEVYPSA